MKEVSVKLEDVYLGKMIKLAHQRKRTCQTVIILHHNFSAMEKEDPMLLSVILVKEKE